MEALEKICDITNKALTKVPESVLQTHSLKMLYLDKNKITFLPENLFESLPNLVWLDVRDNLLENIPRSIGQHKCLENLLLQNNRITHLPPELSRVTSLKVLQISGNPLVYPPANVVECGLDDVMTFLQQEYYKENKQLRTGSTQSATSMSSDMLVSFEKNRTPSGTMQLEVLPTLMEDSLSKRILQQRQIFLEDKCNHGKVHNVIKNGSRTTVRSYYKSMNIRDLLPTQDKRTAEQIKQVWMGKLQELVADQERILQQERAMVALKDWRKIRSRDLQSKVSAPSAPPFDTNPAYNAYMSREDVTTQVTNSLKEQQQVTHKDDINKIIQDIMAELQAARDKLTQSESSEERVQNAEAELQLVMAMHKKITKLQKPNFV